MSLPLPPPPPHQVWAEPGVHRFAELLIDCEEDRTLRALLVGMLSERAESLLIRRRPEDHVRKGRRPALEPRELVSSNLELPPWGGASTTSTSMPSTR